MYFTRCASWASDAEVASAVRVRGGIGGVPCRGGGDGRLVGERFVDTRIHRTRGEPVLDHTGAQAGPVRGQVGDGHERQPAPGSLHTFAMSNGACASVRQCVQP